jgi:sugar phosphate isomerase/epimerase
MRNQGVTRRDMIKWSVAGALWRSVPLRAQERKVPIGVQLYSVRDDCAKDFDAALKQIAEMGFEGVEFAGYYKYKDDAAGLKKKLDELGLKAAGTHIGTASFEGDALNKTIDFHKTIGCKFLIVPGERRFTDPEKSKEYAELMNKTAQALKSEGMFCGHHNHTTEFKKADGKTYWELFGERTSKDVILQMDIGWVREAGLDPVDLIKKFPGRIKTTHVKAKPPSGKGKVYIGQDDFDWQRVLAACSGTGGTDWFLIEQEEYPEGKSPMECTRISLDGLKAILKR